MSEGGGYKCGYLIRSDDLAVTMADNNFLSGNNQKAAPATSPPSPARMDSAVFSAAHSVLGDAGEWEQTRC